MGNDGDRKLALIQAPSDDGAAREKDAKKKRGTSPEKKKQEDDGLSEEDKKVKEDMELLVERLQDTDRGVVALALQTLSMELKAATSSMTSVPKPLKFLRPYIPVLVAHYQSLHPDDSLKPEFAMMLAVLCTTCGDGKRRSLHFCLEAGCKDVESWGYEFMRNLAGEVASAYAELHGEEKKAGAVDEEEGTAVSEAGGGGGGGGPSLGLQKGEADDAEGGSKPSARSTTGRETQGESPAGAAKDAGEKMGSSVPGATTPPGAGAVAKTKKPSPPAVLQIPTMPTVPLPDANALNVVVDLIVPYYMTHNAEVDAVDLLTEVERIEHITQFVDSNNYQRVSLYLLSMANYAASSEEFSRLLKVAFDILLDQKEWYDALRVALRLGPGGGPGGGGGGAERSDDQHRVRAVIERCREDKLMLKQLALLLARQGVEFEFDDEQIQRLNTNEELSRFFLLLAKETDVLEPKTPEDVYKTYLEENTGGGGRRGPGGSAGALDSAKQNLASTFVNAFVNAASCKDKLMLEDGGSWLYKNKDHGMLSAVASLGAILLWNIDEGLTHLDKYQYSSDAHIKAGALLGFGVLSSSVRHECDAAFALLKDRLEDTAEGGSGQSATCQKVGAVIGLGCAYAGTKRADVMESLTVLVVDSSLAVECSAFAALSLGLVFVGSCNQEAAEAILTTLLDRATVEKGLDSPLCYCFALGLGLLYLGTRDACEAILTALEALFTSSPASGSPNLSAQILAAYAQLTVEGMAYAGSGDVLKAQKFLSVCAEARDKKYWSSLYSRCAGAEGGAGAGESTGETSAAGGGEAEGGEKKEKSGAEGRRRGSVDGSREKKSSEGESSGAGAGGSDSNTAGKGPAASRGGGSEEDDDEDEEDSRKLDQAVAVMNVALLSFAEDVGAEMSLRMMDHFLQYADLPQRRAVPLALALHSPSRAKPGIIDTLSKLSHDVDAEVALNAIFAMGIVGAGTNNARIAALLRSLASYYCKDSNALFVIRLAQGLLYMGKGLLSINPLHSDRFLIHNVTLGCLCVILHTCLHMRHTILSQYHFLLYYLFPAMHPRMLFTVAPASQCPQPSASTSSPEETGGAGGATSAGGADVPMTPAEKPSHSKDEMEEDADIAEEELKMVCIPARVGEAVDIVGQVGRQPKTITAFQTHTTPVLLSYSERAELASDEYVPLAKVLEGVVILKKNPDYKAPKSS